MEFISVKGISLLIYNTNPAWRLVRSRGRETETQLLKSKEWHPNALGCEVRCLWEGGCPDLVVNLDGRAALPHDMLQNQTGASRRTNFGLRPTLDADGHREIAPLLDLTRGRVPYWYPRVLLLVTEVPAKP
jgi:hypothetical protein